MEARIIEEEHLNPEKTQDFIERCFREGDVKETGMEITQILPPMYMFSKDRKDTKLRLKVTSPG